MRIRKTPAGLRPKTSRARRKPCEPEFKPWPICKMCLCAGPLGVAADLPGHGCGRQGWRHQARHVGNKSARLPGDFLQVAELRRSRSRLSLALCQGATAAWTHRYFQSQLLRRDLGRAYASRVSHRTEVAERMRQQRDLEAPL